jgi:hypothetical protein
MRTGDGLRRDEGRVGAGTTTSRVSDALDARARVSALEDSRCGSRDRIPRASAMHPYNSKRRKMTGRHVALALRCVRVPRKLAYIRKSKDITYP